MSLSTQSPPNSVTLVKLGGAVLTDKSMPNTLRPEVLKRLVQEVKSAWKDTGEFLVVGHGAGSFAHVPAAHYDTMNGFRDEYSRLGMAIVQDSAAQLNRLVVREFLENDVPAVSSCASSSAVTENKKLKTYFTAVFEEYLKQGLLPVTYGDVIVDSKIGCTIWSTDVLLAHCAREFLSRGWHVKKIVHATQVAGVMKNLGRPEDGIFEVITPANAEEVKKAMGVTKGFDVTGGMWGKISESLDMTAHGVETVILSGDNPGMLERCLRGEEFFGTVVKA